MPTKKQLEAELAAARETIKGLRGELANARPESKEPNDPEWSALRVALSGYVPEKADHYDLVKKAAELVKAWDDLPEVAKETDFTDRSCDDILEAWSLLDAFAEAGTTLDEIGLLMWRRRLVSANAEYTETLGALQLFFD